MSRVELAVSKDRELSAAELEKLYALARRRLLGEPMAYLLGRRDFYAHSFHVNPHTLIPRPETELLVDLALDFLPQGGVLFLDAGCGCGCIGLSLLAARPEWRGVLLDISSGALRCARQNAMEIAPRAMFAQGDFFNPPFPGSSLDLIVSNPPYIGRHELSRDQARALAFEPQSALFSDEEGLGHLKALAKEAMRCLKPGALCLAEHGASQREGAEAAFKSAGFRDIRYFDDLAGLPRCVAAAK